jgi:hypothetical protein
MAGSQAEPHCLIASTAIAFHFSTFLALSLRSSSTTTRSVNNGMSRDPQLGSLNNGLIVSFGKA